MMKNTEFVKMALLALQTKTLYVTGGIGEPLTESNKKRLLSEYSKNRNEPRCSQINNAGPDVFAFDCCGLVKSIIWGWCADPNHYLGGARYESNGMTDDTCEQLVDKLVDKSEDFENISPGEMCYMNGHVGIYVGNRMSVECTSKWDGMVQITGCNYTFKDMWRRDWIGHGKLPQIDYSDNEEIEKMCIFLNVDLKKGDKGPDVLSMQKRICQLSEDYEERMNACSMKNGKLDGSFGAGTVKIVKSIQSDCGLPETGELDAALRNILNTTPMTYYKSITSAISDLSVAGHGTAI